MQIEQTIEPARVRGFALPLAKLRAAWLRVAHAIALVQTTIILAVVYFVVITPAGLVMRLFRPARKFDPNLASYRMPAQSRSPHHLERPF